MSCQDCGYWRCAHLSHARKGHAVSWQNSISVKRKAEGENKEGEEGTTGEEEEREEGRSPLRSLERRKFLLLQHPHQQCNGVGINRDCTAKVLRCRG